MIPVNHLGTWTSETADLNFWLETGSLSVINGTVIPIKRYLFYFSETSSGHLYLFFLLFSNFFPFHPFLSSSNCGVYGYKIPITGPLNSGGWEPGTFYAPVLKKEGACFLNILNTLLKDWIKRSWRLPRHRKHLSAPILCPVLLYPGAFHCLDHPSTPWLQLNLADTYSPFPRGKSWVLLLSFS